MCRYTVLSGEGQGAGVRREGRGGRAQRQGTIRPVVVRKCLESPNRRTAMLQPTGPRKGRIRCMRGFGSVPSAARFCRGHDELRNFLRVHFLPPPTCLRRSSPPSSAPWHRRRARNSPRRLTYLSPPCVGSIWLARLLTEPSRVASCSGMLPQFGEQSLRILQVPGVEAFGEPGVNRGEQRIRGLAFALALPQACEAG